MNRWDEIKASALDVAQHITQEPAKRDALADDLITLIGHMIAAAGKGLAVKAEGSMNDVYPCNDPECDCAENGCRDEFRQQHTLYLAGEELQRAVSTVVDESVSANLARYETEPFPSPVWRPKCPDCGIRVGMPNGGLSGTPWVHRADCTQSATCGGCGASTAEFHVKGCPVQRGGEWAPSIRTREVLPPVTGCPYCKRYNTHLASCPVLSGKVKLPSAARPGCQEGCVGDRHVMACQRHCPVLPGGQGPACDWDATCPVHGMPANAGLDGIEPGARCVAEPPCEDEACRVHADPQAPRTAPDLDPWSDEAALQAMVARDFPGRSGNSCDATDHNGCEKCRCQGCGEWVPQAEHADGRCVE